ncbi:MAG: restriction endonuclease subunit S [Desulfobacteraceae bacterium]|nr:restriction endonuclease subunit S [Desulfobacteraceae bacterium]
MVEAMEIKAGFKQTEVGVIPSDWEVKKLADLVDKFVNGGTPSTQITEYWNGNIPWITGADILNQKVAVIRRYISKEAVKNSSTNIIEKGNLLLVSRTGVGKIAITPFDIAISQDFTGIYVKSSELDTVYLFRYFDFAQKELKTQNQGTSIQGITRETLSSIKIPLPPTKAEQTAIATALNDADALITQLEKLIAKKRDIKQGAMQELLKPKEGWEVKQMGKIAELYQPVTISQEHFTEDGYLVYGANGIVGRYSKYNHEHWQTTITCRGSTCGTVNRTVDKCWITGNAMVANVDKNESVDKMFFYFMLSRQDYANCITGSGQPQIVRKPLSEFELSFPREKSEQTRIAQILSDMDTEIEALENKLEKHKMIKQGMMQNLLTGKIRLI